MPAKKKASTKKEAPSAKKQKAETKSPKGSNKKAETKSPKGSNKKAPKGKGEDPLVPVISIKNFLHGTEKQQLAVAKEIGKACADIGFFVITDHGVDQKVADAIWEGTKNFFDLDAKDKKFCDMTEEYPYGYETGEILVSGKNHEQGKSKDANPRAPDIKETLSFGPTNPKSGMPPRQYPKKPAGFKKAVDLYYKEMEKLSAKLLEAFALALDLPRNFFEDKIDRHLCALRLLNYPDQKGMKPLPGQLRCSQHTDYGSLTILRSGGPGLQVSKDSDNVKWVDVQHIEGGLVINLGDLMKRWTNDRWSSTLHRVINPPQDGVDHRRQSIAFFHNVNGDTNITAIDTCVDKDHPIVHKPILARDLLMAKHLASQGIYK